MKSKRAEEYLDRKSPVKTVGDSKFYYPINRLEAENAVELAEQDAEERIEALKARAVEAFPEYMEQAHGGYLTSDLDNFLQKLNER